jgi:hypothetical protein
MGARRLPDGSILARVALRSDDGETLGDGLDVIRPGDELWDAFNDYITPFEKAGDPYPDSDLPPNYDPDVEALITGETAASPET